MSPARTPASPPQLPGFEYLAHLGSGGFADVYLYEDPGASREVAVKVLLANAIEPAVRRSFESETRLMGRLSAHPSIVTVYQTGVAPDGRPYLVMEYCPRPSLGARFRQERMPLPEALDIMVAICGAVETAHRAGIVHRDIKPANILVTDYGRAALTDFGIASARAAGDSVQGMSVPWAPPEFIEGVGDVHSDVWSLAATLYSLLAGRSPFEIPGADNSASALLTRIAHDPLPPLDRPDVPPVVDDVLRVAMAASPRNRFPSALALGRELQRVQASLQLPETTIEIPRRQAAERPGNPADRPDEAGDGTRISGVRTVDPAARPDTAAGAGREFTAVPALPPREEHVTGTRMRAAATSDAADARRRDPAPDAPRGGARTAVIVAAVVAVAAAAGAGAWFALGPGGSGQDEAAPDGRGMPVPTRSAQAVPVQGAVPQVTAGRAERAGDGAVFTWQNPDPQPGDVFRWVRTGTARAESPREVDAPRVQVPGMEAGCIEVRVVRASGRTSRDGTEVCLP